MRLARTDRSVIAEWWFSVDRPMLVGDVLLMMLLGRWSCRSRPAPAAAHKIGAEPLYLFRASFCSWRRPASC